MVKDRPIKQKFHSWVEDGSPQQRKNALYKGDPERQNWKCLNCKSTKSTLIWFIRGKKYERLNKYKACLGLTCAQKAGFNNRKFYRTSDIITREQTNKLINKIEDEKVRVLTKILYIYAPRISEAILLQKKDLMIKQDSLRLNRFILKVPKEPDGNPPQRFTYCPLQDSFTQEIINWFENTPDPNDYVFPRERYYFGNQEPTDYRKHISRSYAIRLVKEATGRSCHFFRHLRISHWAMMVKTQFGLQKKTHHFSAGSLDKYTHFISDVDEIEAG